MGKFHKKLPKEISNLMYVYSFPDKISWSNKKESYFLDSELEQYNGEIKVDFRQSKGLVRVVALITPSNGYDPRKRLITKYEDPGSLVKKVAHFLEENGLRTNKLREGLSSTKNDEYIVPDVAGSC